MLPNQFLYLLWIIPISDLFSSPLPFVVSLHLSLAPSSRLSPPYAISTSWPHASDSVLVKRLWISWFPQLHFCGRCRNLKFTIRQFALLSWYMWDSRLKLKFFIWTPVAAVDGNTLAGSMCVRGPAPCDSFRSLCIVLLIGITFHVNRHLASSSSQQREHLWVDT